MKTFGCIIAAIVSSAVLAAEKSDRPETWFHIIGGNASKEGMVADLDAIKDAGIGGIQFFHGQGDGSLWPGVTNPIPCLSEKWIDLVKFASDECHRRGLTFKVQNCPGWSMSGGPWITPDKAMRQLVCFEPGKKPEFDADADYHEICTLTFPVDTSARMITLPTPSKINYAFCYEPDIVFSIWKDGVKQWERKCPAGNWSDAWSDENNGMTFDITGIEGDDFRVTSKRDVANIKPVYDNIRRIDNWQAKSSWTLRELDHHCATCHLSPVTSSLTLTFGHVNMKRRNHPAPPEATGWECDKLSRDGFEANWNGYVGKLIAAGVKIDGLVVDSWECGSQNWTWKMEEEFKARMGYELRPWLPALFGYPVKSIAETEKFLLDWRNCLSRMIEENYYGVIAEKAKAAGISVQYETAFGDVLTGDLLRYWKFADEPMCEFWSPHHNHGFVGSFDFKPVLPCVSAAHVYGKKRVSAESLTSFELTFDENFANWKQIIDAHFGRGITHIVFHTYTHNPVVGGKAPGSSFGGGIGSPFLRLQPWWKFMKEFTDYIAFCGHELERGLPVVDILMYLGDDVNHKPSESKLLFDNRYKYDYLNNDALMTRVSVKDGRITFPDGMSYRVLWIPKGTFVLPETEKKFAELEQKGARIIRGDFTPDWPSPLAMLGGAKADWWYQRRDGDEDIFFLAVNEGESLFWYFKNGKLFQVVDAVTREGLQASRGRSAHDGNGRLDDDGRARIPCRAVALVSCDDEATLREYRFEFDCPIATTNVSRASSRGLVLDLGEVHDWATVYVNGREVARLWCPPYACDIAKFVKPGKNEIRIEVTSTIYNQLVLDAAKPEAERKTWTLNGPKSTAPLHPAGLNGMPTLRQW